MFILIDKDVKIPMSDEQLDQIKVELEAAAERGGGIWLKGDLQRAINGEPTYPDPDVGHQELWVHCSRRISLIYDRPLNEDPDRL